MNISQKKSLKRHLPGLAITEFKRDHRDGRLKFSEINSRMGLTQRLSTKKIFRENHNFRKRTWFILVPTSKGSTQNIKKLVIEL
jgi:hypothetical protein